MGNCSSNKLRLSISTIETVLNDAKLGLDMLQLLTDNLSSYDKSDQKQIMELKELKALPAPELKRH